MTSEQQFDSLDEYVRHLMERWTVPGMAVGILREGAVETYGYGVTSLETGCPVRADTLFQIGSISKVFTATLIMRLAEEGLVGLDEPVRSYLPDLRLADEGGTITLRHLLTHTSGLFGDYFDDHGLGDDALAKAITHYHTLRQLTPPGSLWTYCNSGFNLAGAVVERLLGTTFEAAMGERIFQPLSLERSFYFAHEAIVYPVAVGHTQKQPGQDEHEIARHYPLPRCVHPAGGIISTVGDLLAFAAFHMGDGTHAGAQVLSGASLQAMQQRQTSAANWSDLWGIGWDLRLAGDTAIIGHGGSTNGFQARLTLVPDQQFAIAMLTNSGRGSVATGRLGEWALQHYCAIQPHRPAQITLSEPALATFAGHYRQPYADVTISVQDGGLRVEITSKSPLADEQKEVEVPPFSLKPIGQREFVITTGEGEGGRIDFIPGDDGTPRFIRMHGRLADRV